MSPTGIDEAWSKADPAAAKRAGVQVVSMYLSRDASKNATAAMIKAYHREGIAVLLNWEAVAGAPLSGAGPGHDDAIDAVAQVRTLIREVGYAPASKLAIPFSCDTDTSASQRSGPIRAYYEATGRVVHAAGMLNGVYGEADLCDYLGSHKITDMEWETYAWSGGRLSKLADFYQYSNNHTLGGGSVDYDRVLHAAQVGAWWPPNHPLNKPNPITPNATTTGDDMPLLVQDTKTKRRYLLFGTQPPKYITKYGASVAARVFGISATPLPRSHSDLVNWDMHARAKKGI